MDRVRLQFWNSLRYLSTFLCLVFGGLAVLGITGRMPHALEESLRSRIFPFSAELLPPQLNGICIPLGIGAMILFLIARVSSRRRRLWRPSGFDALPAPNGGYLRTASFAQLKRELKKQAPAARRRAIEFFKLADRHFAGNRYKEAATEYQKSAFAVSTKAAYLNLGVSFCYVSYLDRAANAFETGMPIARREGDEKFEAAFLCNAGILQKERGELTEALTCFKQAYSTGGRIGDSIGQACALGNIGGVYLLQGRIDEAMKSWEMTRERFERAGPAAGRATALDNIGSVYSAKWDFKRALKCHRKAYRLYRDIHNVPGQTNTLANIGYVRFKLDRRRGSLRASHAALKLAERLGSFLDRAKAHGNIGLVYEKKGRLEEALTSVQKSLELYKQIGSPIGIGNQLASIGVIYAAQDRKNEALLKWGEARSKFLQTGARSVGYHTVETAIELSLHDNS